MDTLKNFIFPNTNQNNGSSCVPRLLMASQETRNRTCGVGGGGISDSRWAEKAIQTLVKKIKEANQDGALAIRDLEYALETPVHGQMSNCVKIPRSRDGRLQVLHRKELPHVIYCRLWRFADLQNYHELKPIAGCAFHFEAKHEDVCINPYHYQRVPIQKFPPIMVPHSSAQQVRISDPGSELMALGCQDQNYSQNTSYSLQNAPSQGEQQLSYNSQNQHQSLVGSDDKLQAIQAYQGGQCLENNTSQTWRSAGTAWSRFISTVTSSISLSNHGQNGHMKAEFAVPRNMPSQAMTAVAYDEPPNWCKIRYKELGASVGECFLATTTPVTVDGFTGTILEKNRFCLGQLSNLHRNESIENTRRHIGKGINLSYDGQVVRVQCNSAKSVFVQSFNFNRGQNIALSSVCKIPSGHEMPIFDYKTFYTHLETSARLNFQAVFNMTHDCHVKLSFVKGWGEDYHRQEVTSTPCWIEITIQGALMWVDNVLKQMPGPSGVINSFS